MSARTAAVLGRFPRHLDAATRGKLFGAVVDALGQGLDVQTAQVGDIRRAHRLGDAPTPLDVLRLGGLHGIGVASVEPVTRRLAALGPVVVALAGATGGLTPEDADDAALALVGVGPAAFARPEDAGDPVPARRRLADALAPQVRFEAGLGVRRDVVASLIGRHAAGNATPDALLGAAAAYLALDVLAVDHSDDRWWHLATCTDRLSPPSPAGPAGDLLALEENPPAPADAVPGPRRHGERFAVARRGLEAVRVAAVVTGVEDRTVQPMVVNLDLGAGVAFEGPVPAGGSLRFEADGRVTLDGALVLGRSFSFRGSVFADEAAPVPTRDFRFAPDGAAATEPPRPVDGVLADRTAHWAVTEPVGDAFATDGAFPHAGGLLEPLWLAQGRTRWAVFVGPGTFGGTAQVSAPRFRAGVFDRSVFEPDVTAVGPPSLGVGFEWEEREAFAVRLWIPMRFQALDGDGEPTIAQRLRALLDRHRAAGVRLTVEYADPRWTLGVGVLRDLDSTDPRGLVVTGTTAWPADTVQPPPS